MRASNAPCSHSLSLSLSELSFSHPPFLILSVSTEPTRKTLIITPGRVTRKSRATCKSQTGQAPATHSEVTSKHLGLGQEHAGAARHRQGESEASHGQGTSRARDSQVTGNMQGKAKARCKLGAAQGCYRQDNSQAGRASNGQARQEQYVQQDADKAHVSHCQVTDRVPQGKPLASHKQVNGKDTAEPRHPGQTNKHTSIHTYIYIYTDRQKDRYIDMLLTNTFGYVTKLLGTSLTSSIRCYARTNIYP